MCLTQIAGDTYSSYLSRHDQHNFANSFFTNLLISQRLLVHAGDRRGQTLCQHVANGTSVPLLSSQTLCNRRNGLPEACRTSSTVRQGLAPRLLLAWFIEGSRMGVFRLDRLSEEHTCCRKERECPFVICPSVVHLMVLADVRAAHCDISDIWYPAPATSTRQHALAGVARDI